MELIVGIVGAENLPKFWSNFTDVRFVPIQSGSKSVDDRVSCLIYYYDLLSSELPSLGVEIENLPYIVMWVGVDLTPEQASQYPKSFGNYVVKGNIEQHAKGIHATAKALAINRFILTHITKTVELSTPVIELTQQLQCSPEDINSALINEPSFDVTEGEVKRVARQFYEVRTENGIKQSPELFRLAFGSALEAYDIERNWVMIAGDAPLAPISNLSYNALTPQQIQEVYPELRMKLRQATGGDIVSVVHQEMSSLKEQLLRELRIGQHETSPQTSEIQDILLENVTYEIGEIKVSIRGQARNPNPISVNNLYCVAYSPRAVAWGPEVLQAGEIKEFHVELDRAQSGEEAKVVITRRVGEACVKLRPQSPQIMPVTQETQGQVPTEDYALEVLRPFEEKYELKEGDTRMVTALVRNTGNQSWKGAFLAPKFPGGVFMPIATVPSGTETELGIQVGPYPPQLYKLEYQTWHPEVQRFGPEFYFLVKVVPR